MQIERKKLQQEIEAEENNEKMRGLIDSQSVLIDQMRLYLVIIKEQIAKPIPTRQHYKEKYQN